MYVFYYKGFKPDFYSPINIEVDGLGTYKMVAVVMEQQNISPKQYCKYIHVNDDCWYKQGSSEKVTTDYIKYIIREGEQYNFCCVIYKLKKDDDQDHRFVDSAILDGSGRVSKSQKIGDMHNKNYPKVIQKNYKEVQDTINLKIDRIKNIVIPKGTTVKFLNTIGVQSKKDFMESLGQKKQTVFLRLAIASFFKQKYEDEFTFPTMINILEEAGSGEVSELRNYINDPREWSLEFFNEVSVEYANSKDDIARIIESNKKKDKKRNRK